MTMKFEDCKNYKKCEDGLYRYVYVTICLNNEYKNNFYIGKHRHENIENNYIGSGTLIKQYKKQYPKEYKKIILGTYLTDEEQSQAELYYINEYFNDPKCMNLSRQSSKGTTNFNHTDESIQKMSDHWQEYYKTHDGHTKGIYPTKETRKKMSDHWQEYYKTHDGHAKGTYRTKETRKKLSIIALNRGPISEETSKKFTEALYRRYENETPEQKQKRIDRTKGTRYMTDGITGAYLKPEEWGEFIDIGFYFKRKTNL